MNTDMNNRDDDRVLGPGDANSYAMEAQAGPAPERPGERVAATAGQTVAVENILQEAPGRERPSPTERVTGSAREQAGVAAEALRRGEFMRDVSVDAGANSDDRLIALLCYASQIIAPLILPILVLLSESSRKRPFQRFHAIQSLALMLLFVVVGLLVMISTLVLQIVPIIGLLIGAVVFCLSPIAVLMAWLALVYYGLQAYQGKRFTIPGLTSFLRDQGWI